MTWDVTHYPRDYDEAGDYREKDPLLGDPDHLLARQHDYGAAFRGVTGLLTCDWITGPENQPPTALGTIPDQIVDVDFTSDITANQRSRIEQARNRWQALLTDTELNDVRGVPVSSPDYSHWRGSVFGREVMVPNMILGVSDPFSAVTLQAMADVGYVVDVSLADDYQLPNTVPPRVAADAPGQVIDLSNDVVRGPVMVIDTDGRIVRVVPPPPGSVLPSYRRQEVRIDRRGSDGPVTWKRSPSRQGPPRR